MTTTKPNLSDGDRLGQRFKQLKEQSGMTKASFAREFKVPGGASMISQHISGNRPISLEAAVCYMAGFGCSMEEISPSLANLMPPTGIVAASVAFTGSATGEHKQNQPQTPVDTAVIATNSVAIKPLSVFAMSIGRLFDKLTDDQQDMLFGKITALISDVLHPPASEQSTKPDHEVRLGKQPV